MSEPAWKPLAPGEIAGVLADFPARWWIVGGHALDLHLGGALREHGDLDVTILRHDQLALRRHLAAWDLQIAHDGRLEPWPRALVLELPRSGLWGRRDPTGPWEVQFLLADHEDDRWTYRRDELVTLPVADLGLRSAAGIPYVRPEVVLLWKSHRPRERDEEDFAATLPALSASERARLASWLPTGHPWLLRL